MPIRDHDSVFSEAEWKAIQARLDRPPKEQFEDMVRRGVIDRQGNVLIRMPYFGDENDEEDTETGSGTA